MKIDTNPEIIEEFLTRGVENVYPNRDYVKKLLLSGKKLKIYLGVDPTGPTLHLGHAIQLKKLGELQKLGHEIILLIGDFTAMIGDPTDKTAVRKQLTRAEVLNNCRLYKKQASVFLDFSWGGAKLRYNSDWLAKMNFADVLNLASKMTVQQMLERDMFQKRIAEGKPVSIHEFMYPLMQGYDSVAMDVDGEIGGNDQTFNMLTGRNLMKEISGKEKFVITSKLLEDNSGKKMGKTDNNGVNLNDDAFEKFGKIMSWTDGMMMAGFELCTYVTDTEMEKIKGELTSGVNPRDIKVRLAKEIVTIYHNKEEADKAEQNFFNTFKDGGLPEKVDEEVAGNGDALLDISVKAGLVKSKGEFRRLVLEGAVSNQETGDKITDPNFKVISTTIFKIGKRRFLKVVIK